MKIEIAKQYPLFSHRFGAACLLPGTDLIIRAFPTRIQIGALELGLKLSGPVKNFILQQDLDKNVVWVSGEAKEGFFRLCIRGSSAGIEVTGERLPPKGILYFGAEEGTLTRKEPLFFQRETSFFLPERTEILSLGSHKALDVDLMLRRFDLRELLPRIFLLGQRVPPEPLPSKGTARLLDFQTPESLEIFCRAAFSDLLVPRLQDHDHQGLFEEETVAGNAAALLPAAYQKIRALFFHTFDRRVTLLPQNFFDAGRLIGLHAPGIGIFSLEWTKGALRRATFLSETTGDLILELPKRLKSFRLHEGKKSRVQKGTDPLFVEEGKTYFLDRFQK